jgi:hypothetical protein
MNERLLFLTVGRVERDPCVVRLCDRSMQHRRFDRVPTVVDARCFCVYLLQLVDARCFCVYLLQPASRAARRVLGLLGGRLSLVLMVALAVARWVGRGLAVVAAVISRGCVRRSSHGTTSTGAGC